MQPPFYVKSAEGLFFSGVYMFSAFPCVSNVNILTYVRISSVFISVFPSHCVFNCDAVVVFAVNICFA